MTSSCTSVTVKVLLPGADLRDPKVQPGDLVLGINPHWNLEMLFGKLKEHCRVYDVDNPDAPVHGEFSKEAVKERYNEFEEIVRSGRFREAMGWATAGDDFRVMISNIVLEHINGAARDDKDWEEIDKCLQEWMPKDLKREMKLPLHDYLKKSCETGFLRVAVDATYFLDGYSDAEVCKHLYPSTKFLHELREAFRERGHFFLDTGKCIVQALVLNPNEVASSIFDRKLNVGRLEVHGVTFSGKRAYFYSWDKESEESEKTGAGIAGSAWALFLDVLQRHADVKSHRSEGAGLITFDFPEG